MGPGSAVRTVQRLSARKAACAITVTSTATYTSDCGAKSTMNFTINVSGPAVTPVPSVTKGDVNGSGSIDIIDALLIAQWYVGINPANFNQSAADVNCSGSVDIIDALLVAQRYVGLISNFPC